MANQLAALHLAIALFGSDGPQVPVPQPFIGMWALDSAACDDAESTRRMDILVDRLQFYEWGAGVANLESPGDLSVRFDGEWWDVNDTDADERPIVRTKSTALTLSPDRTHLELDIDGDRAQFVRCPDV